MSRVKTTALARPSKQCPCVATTTCMAPLLPQEGARASIVECGRCKLASIASRKARFATSPSTMMYRDLRTIGPLSLALLVGCAKSAEPAPPAAPQPPGQLYGAPGAYGAPPYGGAAPVAPVQPRGPSSQPPGQMAPLGAVLSDPG